MDLPPLSEAVKLKPNGKRLLVAAYGFEDRSFGWTTHQSRCEGLLSHALLFDYSRPKGPNRVLELQSNVIALGATQPTVVSYDYGSRFPGSIEETIEAEINRNVVDVDEVIVDISAMSKLLILLTLCKLTSFAGVVRIVYSEAEEYAPTLEDYDRQREPMGAISGFPTQGVESIIRTKCLSSIRMQGQPVSLIAFTSFNEQLVRHMLGTLSPHRLLFINGRPDRIDYGWREKATQQIHQRLIDEYVVDNPINEETGLLERAASTLDYRETVARLHEIYNQIGLYERLIVAATGSKMQTVGLFIGKMLYPDMHVEYPTPNSYFVTGLSSKVRLVHEVVISNFREFTERLVHTESVLDDHQVQP
jgi:hypothetical protein